MAVRALRRRRRDCCNPRGNASRRGYAGQALLGSHAAPPGPYLQSGGVGAVGGAHPRDGNAADRRFDRPFGAVSRHGQPRLLHRQGLALADGGDDPHRHCARFSGGRRRGRALMGELGLGLIALVGVVLVATGLPAFAVLIFAAVLGATAAVASGSIPFVLLGTLSGRLINLLESDLLQALPLYVL